MQQNSSPTICLTKQHLQILQCIDTLFTRWSLRKNTYFFKHMKSNLQLPLFIIAQERRISQITQSQAVIVQALKMSQFVEVNQQARSVRFVELNTIRVADQGSLIKVQKLLKEYIKDRALDDKINVTKPPEYIISTKTDDGYYYITFKQKPPQNPNIFSKIVEQYNKKNLESPILFSIQPMYEDIKQYITKIRKSKQNEQQRYNNKYSNNSYNKGKGNYTNSYHVNNQSQLNMPAYNRQNMMYPNMYYTYGQNNIGKNYGIFIRKAVESQDEYQNETKQEIKNTKANQQKKEQQKTQQSLNQQKNTYPQTQPQHQRQTQYANTQQNTQKYKKYESKQNNKDKNKKNQPKNNKNNNKIVFDDNDFPTIG